MGTIFGNQGLGWGKIGEIFGNQDLWWGKYGKLLDLGTRVLGGENRKNVGNWDFGWG